jgi:hypothetical protein
MIVHMRRRRKRHVPASIPNRSQFRRYIHKFEDRERREPMYWVAEFLLTRFWGKPTEMADGLGVLLLTWNQAFYRYGRFDFRLLKRWIKRELATLRRFRRRDIATLCDGDASDIKRLFDGLLKATRIAEKRLRGRKSPVAVAKALHLLAPRFFPLWDQAIARKYVRAFTKRPAEKYLEFCHRMKDFAKKTRGYVKHRGKSALKLIDEYNYARFTLRRRKKRQRDKLRSSL